VGLIGFSTVQSSMILFCILLVRKCCIKSEDDVSGVFSASALSSEKKKIRARAILFLQTNRKMRLDVIFLSDLGSDGIPTLSKHHAAINEDVVSSNESGVRPNQEDCSSRNIFRGALPTRP